MKFLLLYLFIAVLFGIGLFFLYLKKENSNLGEYYTAIAVSAVLWPISVVVFLLAYLNSRYNNDRDS